MLDIRRGGGDWMRGHGWESRGAGGWDGGVWVSFGGKGRRVRRDEDVAVWVRNCPSYCVWIDDAHYFHRRGHALVWDSSDEIRKCRQWEEACAMGSMSNYCVAPFNRSLWEECWNCLGTSE